jgi:hypothetical protein
LRLRFELDVHQVLVVGDAQLAVSVWYDERSRFVFRVEDGWVSRGRKA